MKCPKCGGKRFKTIDSRNTDWKGTEESIRRRRECLDCGHRFTTYELRADQLTFEGQEDD